MHACQTRDLCSNGSYPQHSHTPDLPVCTARLAVRTHSGQLPRLRRSTIESRTAAGQHLKLAAWVLTTIKLYDPEESESLNPAEEPLSSSAGYGYGTGGDNLDSGLKRAREDDSEECCENNMLPDGSTRPIKRVRL